MGQVEVFKVLIKAREEGKEQFFCSSEVNVLLNEFGFFDRGLKTSLWLRRLYAYGYLEIQLGVGYKPRYRIKKKYISIRKPI